VLGKLTPGLDNDRLFVIMTQVDEMDVSQFDTKFTKQIPVDSPDDNMLSESANQVFMVRTLYVDRLEALCL
jgi:hypothetical protein